MTVWQAMNRLEALGYTFRLNDEERAAGHIEGERPPEASTLLDIARADPISAADYVRQRQDGALVVDDGCTIPVLNALAISLAVRKGEAELLGKVIFHKRDMTVSLYWKQLTAEDPAAFMNRYRERMKSAIQKRLRQMDDAEWWKLSEDEFDQMSSRYSFLCWLLEEQEGKTWH